METQSNVKLFGNFRKSATKFVMMVACLFGAVVAPAAALTINLVTVDGTGAAVIAPEAYRWTVEEDRTKPPRPGQPSTKANQSFSFHTSYMPVVAAGRVGTPGVASIADPDVARLYAQDLATVNLDTSKRYYVSVAAQGFQMAGAPVVFGVGGATATVTMIKYPVPTAQISVLVFEDNFPVNSTAELPQEKPLQGFTVQLAEAGGTFGQSGGQVTQDAFGNPLGTTYSDDIGTVLVRGTGILLTDANGVVIIKNLYPAKYTIFVAPRIRAGEDWHQTSTIEGTKGVDAWVKNNESPGFYEFGPPGFHVFYGFVNAGNSGCLQGKNLDGTCVGMASTGKTIKGSIVSAHDARPPALTIDQGPPVPQCWVALNNSATSQGLYSAPCLNTKGHVGEFTIPNVLPGTYQLAVWDEPLNTIIGFSSVTVGAVDVDLGKVTQLGWFGRYQGRVFQDIDGTGLPYFEAPFDRPYVYVNPMTGVEEERQQNFAKGDLKPSLGAGVASNIRFRDGSIYQSTTTKEDGTFAHNEVFPFFNWMVAEIDYARFKATSANIVVDNGGPINKADNLSKLWGLSPNASGIATAPYLGSFGSNDPAFAYDPWSRITPQPQPENGGKAFRTENCAENDGQCAILLEGMSLYGNQTNHIEWGKVPYKITENGGIAGIVYYGITRAEDDPRYATAENWEPGIPRVQVNVFLDCDGDGKVDQPKNDGTGQCVELSSNTSYTTAGSSLVGGGYMADLPDVDNYPFCWRDPGSCNLTNPQKGNEDVKRSRTGDANTFSFGDVFKWGAPATAVLTNPTAADQTVIGLGKTDAWDDSIPQDCPTRAVGEPAFAIPYGSAAGTRLDCWDGFRNWNQLRPSVFDGGFAFGRVAGQAELPMIIGAQAKGTYIVEAVAPPGYLHQGNGDKNVTFGDELASRPAALPHQCVGMELDVPPELTLFPGQENPNFNSPQYPNNKWNKCDMKAVPLLPGMNAAPNFFLFTEAPIAAHGVGLLTDDLNNTFDPLSPNWGEKYAPPYVSISIQDWTGRELTRTHSDQYGRYNFLAPSTFTINPPYPSGVMPNMLQACLNHPGPVPVLDANGQPAVDPNTGLPLTQLDPYFNRRYTQQCYTLQYLPGKTTYLDTPMLPVSAFASVEKKPLDCECENKTPGIYSVSNGANGPWVPQTGGTLTIVSNGLVDVPNPAFDPAIPTSPRTIQRDYGFGGNQGSRSVTLNGVALGIATWADDVITANVAGIAPGAYQLMIKRGDNGKESVVGLTVHVGGSSPITVPSPTYPTIQAAINQAVDGDLITIAPGAYNESLILDKRIRLQGWGAGSTYISPIIVTGPAPVAWRALLESKALAQTFDRLPGQGTGIDPVTGLPALLGAEEQSGVLVLGRKLVNGDGSIGCMNAGFPLRVDGLAITGAITGGGILANGYACNLQVSNNRVFGNSGTFGGGVRIGHPELLFGTEYVDAANRSVNMHHNWVAENSATSVGAAGGNTGGGGGFTLGTGSDSYRVENNYVCGNFALSDGAGVSHVGRSTAASIARNTVIFNQNFDQGLSPNGAGVSIAAQLPAAGGAGAGTGDVAVNANLIQGNNSGAGAGSGVSISRTQAGDDVVLTNNMVINNVAGYAGAIALSGNAGKVSLVNNTVASNVSTATTQQAFGVARGTVPSTPQVAGIALFDGAAPTLLNNIVWGNRSYVFLIAGNTSALYNPGTTIDGAGVVTPAAAASYRDLGGVLPTSAPMVPRYSVLTNTPANQADYSGNGCTGTGPTNNLTLRCNHFVGPAGGANLFLNPSTFTTTLQSAVTVDEGGNFVGIIYSPLTLWDISPAGVVLPTLAADYRLAAASTAAVNSGRNFGAGGPATNNDEIGADLVPSVDLEGQARTVDRVDIGADELNAAAIVMAVSPNPAGFGSVSLNTTKIVSILVSNLGNTNLVLTAPTITAGNVTDRFNVAPLTPANGGCPVGGAGLTPNQSCTINVSFAPNAITPSAQTATLNVNGASVVSVPLSGTVVTPVYTITPAAATGYNFGNQPVGTQSAPVQFTLTNTSAPGAELWMNGIPTRVGANPNQFLAAFMPDDTCATNTHLASGASCTFSVVFRPTTVGAKGTGVTSPGANVGVAVTSGSVVTSPVWGTGTVLQGSLVGDPSLAFGNQPVGTSSAARTATFTYSGAGSITLLNNAVSISAANAGQFVQNNLCNGVTLTTGGSCTVSVTFVPTTGGPKAPLLNVGALSATLTGTGVWPAATVSGAGTATNPIGFGMDARGGAAGSLLTVMTITNEIGSPEMIVRVAGVITAGGGTFAQNWVRDNGVVNNCPTTTAAGLLAIGATCNIAYQFNPTGRATANPAGLKTATITVTTTTPGASFAPGNSSVITGTLTAP
jgi:large repetitive protein